MTLNEHFDHLDEVPVDLAAQFLVDVQFVSRALRQMRGVELANIAVLGNRVSHVHAHVIPRRATDSNYGLAPWDSAAPFTALPSGQRDAMVQELVGLLTP